MSYYYNHFNEIIVSADMFPDPHELRLQWEIAKVDERIKTNEAEISRLHNVIEEAQNRINTATSLRNIQEHWQGGQPPPLNPPLPAQPDAETEEKPGATGPGDNPAGHGADPG